MKTGLNIRGKGCFGHVITDMDECALSLIARFCKAAKNNGKFAIDTETTGLTWHKHQCVMVQVYTDDICLVFPLYWGSKLLSADFGWLQRLFFDNLRVYMWNAKFDMHFLQQIIKTTYRNSQIVDGQVLAVMLSKDAFPKVGLKERGRVDLKQDMTDFSDVFVLNETKSLLQYPLTDVVKYAIKDPIVTYWECEYLLDELGKGEWGGVRKVFWHIEQPLTTVLYRMERRGMTIDTGRVEELYEEYSTMLMDIRRRIFDVAKKPFNINSTAQFCDVLEVSGFPRSAYRLTQRSQKPKLDDKAIKHYMQVATKRNKTQCVLLLALLSDYRSIAKLLTTYVIPLRIEDTRVPDPSGKVNKKGEVKIKVYKSILKKNNDGSYSIHPSFNQMGTRTGRVSCDNPNVQNWPRYDKDDALKTWRIRECVIPPRGRGMADLDYSQIELRVLGHASKEPLFIYAYKNDKDLHRELIAPMLKKKPEDVTDDERQLSKKTTSFGVIYGMHYTTLAREYMNGDEKLAKEVVFGFFNRNKKVHRFMIETHRFVHKYGYVDTPFGRRRYLPGIHSHIPSHVAAAERESVNTEIQGGAADLVKMAMIYVDRSKELAKFGITMHAQVHDELIFTFPIDMDVEKIIAVCRKYMEGFHIAKKLLCPLKASGKVGANWAKAH